MLQSTPLHTDAFDAIHLVDLHGCFRHNWASRSASHHIRPSIHVTYLALELRQATVFFSHFYAYCNLKFIRCDQCMVFVMFCHVLSCFVTFDEYSHCEICEAAPNSSPSMCPRIEHIKPVLSPEILLRPPKPRNPETFKPGYIWFF